MKKLTTLFLVLVLFVLSFVGCSTASTNVENTQTTTQQYQYKAADIDHFVNECIYFIESGSTGNFNTSKLSSNWFNYITISLNRYILLISENKRPCFYSIEFLEDDKSFNITIEKSSTPNLKYYFDFWTDNIDDVYVYVSDENIYQEITKQLSVYNKETQLKEKFHLVLSKY